MIPTTPSCPQFRCYDGRCISSIFQCDGRSDCSFGEDEYSIICGSTTVSVPISTIRPNCANSTFRCPNGRCIPFSWLCDGDNDCGNREDELDATCVSYCNASHGLMCRDGLRCIPTWKRCDRVQHCRDGSDETGCAISTTTTTRSTTTVITGRTSTTRPCYQFQCHDGTCIAQRFRCDGIPDCTNGEDESYIICVNGVVTTATPNCLSTQYRCSTGKCITLSWLCDGDNDCGNREDELDATCASYCHITGGFTCNDGQRCIASRKRCDSVEHCRDGSDEKNCANVLSSSTAAPHCLSSQFRCPIYGTCIPTYYLCDGFNDCGYGEDEVDATCVSYCNISQGFMCKDRQRCIAYRKRCDGISHCQDGSDEIGCVCTAQYRPCNNGQCVYESYWCDGITHCEDGSDELPGCSAICSVGNTRCPKDNICISSTLFCNGVYDCSDGSDEMGCGNCTQYHFQCNDTRCIDKDWVCDGKKDCSNGEDELLPSCKKCTSTQFQCVTGNVSCIPVSQRCDGIEQCIDASDESQCISAGADGVNNPGDSSKLLNVTLRGQTNYCMCADDWNKTWSDIVCKQMGYGESNYTSTNLTIPNGYAVVHLNQRAYNSTTSILSSLSNAGTCASNKAIGISCVAMGCGLRAITSDAAGRYIVNGEDAVKGAWPWHVYLDLRLPGQDSFCGGSLINDRWILTATHCVDDIQSADNITVKAGSIYLNKTGDPDIKILQVDKVIIHEQYEYSYARNVIINDVALLRLKQPVTFTETIRPICLAPPDVDLNKFKVCVATGFGKINHDRYVIPKSLRQGKVMPVTTDESIQAIQACRGYWDVYRSDFTYMFGAGTSYPIMGVDTSKGDSGGPLACQNQQNVWTVVGVTSYGLGCQPGFYARVSYYNNWLNNKMALNAN
jgi:hypothetical protein